MKVHIILRKGADDDAISEVVRAGRLTNVNQSRARRFGILTGDAPAEAMVTLRRLQQVESVEIDGIKYALG